MAEFLHIVAPETWVLFISFWSLVGATLATPTGRETIAAKNGESWILDTLCLFVQGAGVPLLQTVMITSLLAHLFPSSSNLLQIPPALAFLLCFVGIDYLYYWNHRILHSRKFWPIHVVHHTADQMDVFTTSRNTLWSSLFLVYLWVNGAMLYFLTDTSAYISAITLTAVLDLWRHSPLQPSGAIAKILGWFLILPQDHCWHHSQDVYDVNFGANLNLWDKLHKTWYDSQHSPTQLGVPNKFSLPAKLLWPF